MHTLEIPEANKKIELPSSWNECTTDQVMDIVSEAFLVMNGDQKIEDFSRRTFCRLTGLKSSVSYQFKRRLGTTYRQDEMLCILAAQLCLWPFRVKKENGQKMYEFQFDTIVNFFREIPTGKQILYGPEDLLQDITFSEFRWANNYFKEHDSCNKENNFEGAMESLDQFVACLYRPGIKGKRSPFDHGSINETLPLIEKVPYIKKFCILLWYSYCVQVIQTTPLMIQGIEIDFSILFPKPTKAELLGLEKRKQGLGWQGTLFDIAESGVFGNIEQTEQTPLFTVLVYMYKKQIENLKASQK